MNCCYKCFKDRYLDTLIRNKGRQAWCDFCQTRRRFVVPAGDLQELFQRFTELYQVVEIGVNCFPDEEAYKVGSFLADLIQETWDTFSDALSEKEQHHDLLRAILEGFPVRTKDLLDVPDVRDFWTDRSFGCTLADQWAELSRNLTKSGDVHDELGDADFLGNSFGWLQEDLAHVGHRIGMGTTFYRARLGYEHEQHCRVAIAAARMGAPPPEKACPGRANAKGTSYLYLASDEGTAVSEVRPANGNYVSVARVRALRDLYVANFARKMYFESPFECEHLPSLVQSYELFNQLGEELAKPLRRGDDLDDYRPTQYLAMWLRKEGFDGVCYPSAMAPEGQNFAFFVRDGFVIDSSRLVEVTHVKVAFADLETPI